MEIIILLLLLGVVALFTLKSNSSETNTQLRTIQQQNQESANLEDWKLFRNELVENGVSAADIRWYKSLWDDPTYEGLFEEWDIDSVDKQHLSVEEFEAERKLYFKDAQEHSILISIEESLASFDLLEHYDKVEKIFDDEQKRPKLLQLWNSSVTTHDFIEKVKNANL